MIYQSAYEVKQLLGSNQEVAFIDLREAAEYGRGHPFFVSHVPYSILESKIRAFVPCLKTALILLDGGDGVSEKASRHLENMDYVNVIILKDGLKAWSDAGFVLYQGISAPSKTFGEVVEHQKGVVSITADELKARMDAADDNFALFDGRTPKEYHNMTIPGSTSCPNAELALRYAAMVTRPDTDIIVNCAGRTRSLIGAQSLRMLNLPNKIYALENGTMGWKIAGFELEYEASRSFPNELSDDVLENAKSKADQLVEKYSIDVISHDCLKKWQSDTDSTTFLFDVRTDEEYTSGHIKGAVHAPGGQLIQATDQWFATRNARIVVFDHNRIRAVIAAIWLKGMGHEAYILAEGDLIIEENEDVRYSNAEIIPMGLMVDKIEDGATLLDVRSSQVYREGHIEGAQWGIRPRINVTNDVVIISDDIIAADLVAKDIGGEVSISLSSTGGWDTHGLKITQTPNNPPDEERIDFQFHTHGRHSGNLDHAREYLRWETGLLDQLDEQEKATLKPL